MIPFNKPYFTGKEPLYINQCVQSGKVSANGYFTAKCEQWFEKKYGFKKAFLTTSCTHALEMTAMLLGIKPGDEVIIPSYTYVSTANAFVLRGATIIFADSSPENPNIEIARLEKLVTPNTKAIVVVHYAGISCDMDKIMRLAKKHRLFVVEDAAHGIDAYYKQKALGSFGHLAAFSFHETKNIITGEGGMLAINDRRFIKRAEIIREKGTNRQAFFRKEVPKYQWVDIGSSYAPSEMMAAILYAQIKQLARIQEKRKKLWQLYYLLLKPLAAINIRLPLIPSYARHNAHLFYLVCTSEEQRNRLMSHLYKKGIMTVFHYQALHQSIFYKKNHREIPRLPNSEKYTNCLVRLPMFYELNEVQVRYIANEILQFFQKENKPVLKTKK